MNFRSSLLAASALAAFLPAQSPGARLLGLTQNTPLIQQHSMPSCNLGPQCPVPLSAPPFLAGASAWDGTSQSLWVSDGFLLMNFQPDACTPVCATPTTSILPVPTSGLTTVESLNTLFEMDLAGNIVQWQLGCSPIPGPICTIASPLPPSFRFTALAADDVRGLLFIGAADPAAAANVILVSDIANPCNPFAVYSVTPCSPNQPLRALTGLAAESCSSSLYLTDGFTTQVLNYTLIPGAPPTVNFGITGCCSLVPFAPVAEPYAGLAIRPRPGGVSGNTCSTGACLPCNPQLVELSDPILGNPAYTVALVNAPSNSIAWIGFNLGTCSGPGTIIPPFCGPILLPLTPSLSLLGPVATGGTPFNCDGFVSSTGPVPLNPALCGLPFSAQAIIFCPATPIALGGTSVTGCLTTAFQGL